MKIYKIANSYYSGDYGSWICHDGGIHRIKEYEGHIRELYNIFRNEGIDVEQTSYIAAEEYGFVRVINSPLSFDFKSLSTSQKETIVNMILEYRGREVYINNKVFNRESEIDKISKLIESF